MELTLLLKMKNRKYLSVSNDMCLKSTLGSIYVFSMMNCIVPKIGNFNHLCLNHMNKNLMEKISKYLIRSMLQLLHITDLKERHDLTRTEKLKFFMKYRTHCNCGHGNTRWPLPINCIINSM